MNLVSHTIRYTRFILSVDIFQKRCPIIVPTLATCIEAICLQRQRIEYQVRTAPPINTFQGQIIGSKLLKLLGIIDDYLTVFPRGECFNVLHEMRHYVKAQYELFNYIN